MLVRSRLSLVGAGSGRVAEAVAVLSWEGSGVVVCDGTRRRDTSSRLVNVSLSASPASVLAPPPHLELAAATTKLLVPSGLVPMDLGEYVRFPHPPRLPS